jgi:glycosyltransferase involved in cell wall biosynthesis
VDFKFVRDGAKTDRVVPMKKKPWLIVTGDFAPTGGMDRVNYYLARYLSQQGHEVEAVAHRFAEGMESWPGIRLQTVPRPARSHFLGEPLLARAGFSAAQAMAQRGGVVLVNGANCPWPETSWVHYVHAAYVSHTPGWRGPFKQWQHALYGRLEAQRLAKMKLLIANSERTKQDLIEHLRIPAEKIQVIYYGCEAQEVFPRSAEFRREKRRELPLAEGRGLAIFVGALGDSRKGFETIFQVWAQEARRPDWNLDLLVVGSGTAQAGWEKKVRAAGLQDRMRFLGFRRDVLEWIGASDVMLHPARYEAYGLGVHEAICSGVPVIVTAAAGAAERMEGPLQNLLLNDPRDPRELTEKMRRWQENEALYKKCAEEASFRWGAQDNETMARQIIAACE